MLQEIRAAWLLLSLGILLAIIQHGNAERKIVCYYTNWSVYRPGTAKFSPQNINPYLCTHLIYAFGGFTKDNTLKPFDKYQDIEKGGYAKFTGLKTYNKNLKTMLAIGGWNEGSSRFSPMVADAGRRRELVKNTVKFLRLNHFDGLDLDWEYPAFRDGGKPRDKENYANLVQELREEFERESSKTGRTRLLLSMAMPAGIEYIDKGYDIPRLNEYLDFINLLSYDYHSAYEPAVNHHSPLYPLEEDSEYNYDSELTIDYTIKHLLKKGASAKKIILGIPTYGRSYTLFNEDASDLGSPADGPGIEGDATREKGYLAYYEICESIAASDDWEVVQPNPKAMGPYAFKENQWVGYDDEDIVRLKSKYVNEKNLGGIMFWSIDNDDFRGKCHGRAYPLIEAAKEALLSDSSRKAIQKSKPLDPRKKNRLHGSQSNAIGRKFGSNGRTSTTTVEPVTRKRITSSRPRYRTIQRFKSSEEDVKEKEEDEEDREVDRRSYNAPSDEEDDEGGNVVRHAEKSERSRPKIKTKTRNRSSRRKQSRRNQEKESSVEEESLSNKLTTPEPPTTPDPGSDFKCEDEGFFSHPRDCKKYFWCLDSGPGGLGIVGHQFTCPSGLVFNKAADSCDYPRNVVCPKSKGSQSTASTTRAPVTAATSRTTYLHSTTQRSTTEKTASDEDEEEYEYYDDEEVEDEEIEEKEERKTTTTPKPLLYKTINRIRSTTVSSALTTEEPATVTLKSERGQSDKLSDFEDEEDPRVIKELIDLIKKAGGIEQLEKQLHFQEKNVESSSSNERVTPATISRTLYERVLSRQANRLANNQRTTSGKNNYANGPGGAQFEGLDDIPEVKNLRRYQKPQYVNIERPKASTREPPVQDEEIEDEEELDEDNTDVASSEEQSISNPFLSSTTQRATPNYVNIRRARPSTTTSRSESSAEATDEEVEEEKPVRRRRPGSLYRNKDEDDSESAEPVRKRVSSLRNTESNKSSEDRVKPYFTEEEAPTTKSRYVNVQRFRSTTVKSSEDTSTEDTSSPATPESITAETSTLEAIKFEKEPDTNTVSSTSPQSVTAFSSTSTTSTTEIAGSVLAVEPLEQSSTTTSVPEGTPTVESLKLVEDSATEILLTTVPASSSQTISSVSSSTSISSSSTKITEAAVFQPRPFGFNRRTRPTTSETTTTTPLPPSKVDTSGSIKLPTLKELVAHQNNDYTATTSSPVQLNLLPAHANNRLDALNIQAPNPSMQEEGPNARYFLENDYDSLATNILTGINGDRRETAQGTSARKDRVYVFPDLTQERNNIENDIEDAATSGRRKTRIDHAGSSTSTVKPTTMRGKPIADLTSKENPRGFYVTKSAVDSPSLTGSSIMKETTEPDFEQATENYSSESTVEDLTDSTTSFLEDEKTTTLVIDTVDDRLSITDQTTESFRETLTTEFSRSLNETSTTEVLKEQEYDANKNAETPEIRFTTMTTDLATEPLTEPVTTRRRGLGTTHKSRSRGTTRNRIRSRSRSRNRSGSSSTSTTTNPVGEQSSVSTITEQTEDVTIKSKLQTTTDFKPPDLLETTTSKEEQFTASSISNTNAITSAIECGNTENVTCSTTTASVTPTTSFDVETSSTTYEVETRTDESTIAESFSTVPSSVTPRISELTAVRESATEKIASTRNPMTDSMSSGTEFDVESTTFTATLESKSTEYLPVTELYVTKGVEDSTIAKGNADFTTTTSKPMESMIDATIGGVVESTTEVAISKTSETIETKPGRGRHRYRGTPSNYGFGDKTSRRTSVRRGNVTSQEAPRETTRNQYPRRRVSVYRGRKRRPNTSPISPTTENLGSSNYTETVRGDKKEAKTEEKLIVGEESSKTESTKTSLSAEREESLDVGETGVGIIEKGGLVEREFDEVTVTLEQEERPVTEVNLREPGSPAATGIRKLGSSKSTSSATQNRSSSGLTNHRRNRPSETTNIPKSTIDEHFDTTEKVTETTERSENGTKQGSEVSDQSSKAQELAVTLAEPPPPQASSTGRSPLRDVLRRKISTTIAPRIDSTTTKSTTRFGQVFRNRQRPKPKDSPLVQKVTSRPRRPQVIDYDYYEDEEEPVVGKNGFNGKLYLTSKGSIRCLDQGNFPHPYSCKKFITCARMVNGQVIGAEYTCPDKLSYDPVGGICNWSAGLGCKE